MIELPTSWAVHEGEAVALLRELPTASCDALVTDHPYSSGGMTRSDRAQGTKSKYVQTGSSSHDLEDFSGDTRDQRSYELWCALWLSEALRVTKPGGVGLLFCDWRQLSSTIDAFQVGGWVFRGVVPWTKPTCRPQKGRFSAACEFVVWGSNGAMPAERGVGVLPGFYTYTPPPCARAPHSKAGAAHGRLARDRARWRPRARSVHGQRDHGRGGGADRPAIPGLRDRAHARGDGPSSHRSGRGRTRGHHRRADRPGVMR